MSIEGSPYAHMSAAVAMTGKTLDSSARLAALESGMLANFAAVLQ